jgi:DNA-binding PadR family transcriptional regulator
MHGHFGHAWRWAYGCAGRHARRHGFGPFAGHSQGDDAGWQGFRAGRKLGGDDLQLLILSLLAEGPAHGYEIMKALGERSGGFYSPSPGMVYPALTYLEEVGYASVQTDGTRKQYSITDDGRAHLEAHRGTIDTLLAQMKWVGEKMEHLRHAFADHTQEAEGGADKPLFGRRRRRWMSFALHQAGLELKAALFEMRDADEAEMERIANILKRAAREVRGK